MATIGASFDTIKIKNNGKEYTFALWDTAGQEKFVSLSTFYIIGAGCVILLYDVTNENSLQSVKETWMEQVKKLKIEKNCFLILVGTKSGHLITILTKLDCELSTEATKRPRKIEVAAAEKVRNEIGAIAHFVTSSKTGDNIDKLFEFIVKQLEKREAEQFLQWLNDEKEQFSKSDVKIMTKEVDRYMNIENIDLSKTIVGTIPIQLFSMTKLIKLDLSWNDISILPEEIGQLYNLEEFNFSKNNVKELPDSLTKLKTLRILDLSSNRIKKLSPKFGNLINLEELNLSCNLIDEVPCELLKLPKIKMLDFSENNLEKRFDTKFTSFHEFTLCFCMEFAKQDFKDEKQIGKGAEGDIIKATEVSTNQEFALKYMAMQNEIHEVTQIRECYTHLVSLDHPNIVKHFDLSRFKTRVEFLGEKIFYVMKLELLSGDLEGLIRNRNPILRDDTVIENWVLQLAKGLNYLHQQGIVHLDIKTQNILHSEDLQTLKLTDLGHAKQTNFQSFYSVGNHGSMFYLPPEIDITSSLPKKYKPSFDIWCFGIVIYQLLLELNEQQFGFENLRGTIKEYPNFVREKLKGRNKKLSYICNMCLQINPEKRPNIEEIIEKWDIPIDETKAKAGCSVQ